MKPTTRHGAPPLLPRLLDLADLVSKKSHFLLGPRQTGKTTLVHQVLPAARVYDLLDSSVFLALSIGDHSAVEAEAKASVSEADLRSLRALAEEGRLRRFVCVSLQPRPRQLGEIRILPVADFLERLWAGEFSE